jgi:hypothetical protein
MCAMIATFLILSMDVIRARFVGTLRNRLIRRLERQTGTIAEMLPGKQRSGEFRLVPG